MSPGPIGDEHISPFRLLFVCTANRCRSPMGEALARRALADRSVEAEVVSAGRMSGGHSASPGAVDAMSRRGIDLSSHRSAPLDPDTLTAADLILVMEREHLSDVFEVEPSVIERTFTLGEFPALLKASSGTAEHQADTPSTRIEHAHAQRDPARILAVDTSSDIADPMGRRRGAYRRTARQLDHLIEATVEGLYPGQPG